MIIDCYTHIWELPAQLGRCLPPTRENGKTQNGDPPPVTAGVARHLAAAHPATTTIVLGFKSHYLGADIPNDQVASYVRNHSDRLIGFAGIDPSRPKEAIIEMKRAKEQLAMRGVAVAPAAQDFHPSNSQAIRVYSEAAELGLPVLFHTGVHHCPATKLQYAQPVLLDEVARELPALKIVVAHLGFPWVEETIALLMKHSNVFAEISGVLHHRWQAYQALISAYECGVINKLLFGSGFPNAAALHCIESLYSINHLCHGTNLPTIPREQLRGIVERDTLSLLGIAAPRPSAADSRNPLRGDDDLDEP